MHALASGLDDVRQDPAFQPRRNSPARLHGRSQATRPLNESRDCAIASDLAVKLCGACKEICPVKIDIPRILLHLRWKMSEGGGEKVAWPQAPARVRMAAGWFARAARYPGMMRVAGRLGALLLKPFAQDGYLRRMPGPFGAWTRVRDFPAPPANGSAERNSDRAS